ncbi:MAG: hypothetical protein FAZ92_00300 [Accumulibacter sp.]|uniref:transposase n=1 Tax=Accumulibacter sp. TaxID=2053492 RepID=UPI001226D482|nr:transposase [Accumulibacter sp.]TLD47421.1 MAG: hypothetical protein FAZ92_00300 [Accumulibacter sp.]
MLAPTLSVLAAGRLVRVPPGRQWRVIEHQVGTARSRESHTRVHAVGVDEKACPRGQQYLSVFEGLNALRLICATPGRDKSCLARFADDLTVHGSQPQVLTHVSTDMSRSLAAGAADHFPQPTLCFGRIQVVELSSKTLDDVRRPEVKRQPRPKGTRWSLPKNPSAWTSPQLQTIHCLQHSNLKIARASRIKQALRAIYATARSPDEARPLSHRCPNWAGRGRLNPSRGFARMLTTHLTGILHDFEGGNHNDRFESKNRALQEARARARGYRRVDTFILMAHLVAGKLCHVSTPPFAQMAVVPHKAKQTKKWSRNRSQAYLTTSFFLKTILTSKPSAKSGSSSLSNDGLLSLRP